MVKQLRILILEDDLIEVMKLKRAISSLKYNHIIIEANDGNKALKFLNQTARLPDIILLDLNMPKINGIQFLTMLKKDEVLKYIPTIILTTSSNQKDLLECYKTGIAGYVLKPLKYKDYVFKIDKLLSYWSINTLIKT